MSILRNWTVGELATIDACIGILAHFMAAAIPLQTHLRMNPGQLAAAIDEILRIHAPLLSSRRVTTAPLDFDGRTLAAGERISLNWASANRNEHVFDNPLAIYPASGFASCPLELRKR